MSVILETTVGDITVDLHVKERPRECLNFLKLCKIKYYNYCLVFNIQRDFIAQTGDPSNSGKGGKSVFNELYGEQAAFFQPETMPPMKHLKIGTLSMANNGSNMHGSQFFITLGENLEYLDDVHTVFGEVAEGLDILQKLNETIVDDTNRPYQDIRINHTVILDDPFPDPTGLHVPERSPSPTPEQLETGRIAPGESIDEYNGKTKEEVEEAIRDKEAKAQAQILEMIGDIPDAEVKPPDNVLFVCKLNAVTTDEDLLVIFSRFGPIIKCEVIRDQKSGDSLQYAFIEFENEEDCASAYFKMDNVLIDDRRIHVDFSQSVSKLGDKYVTNRQQQPQTTGGKSKYHGNQDRKDGYRISSRSDPPRKEPHVSERKSRTSPNRRDSPPRRPQRRSRSSSEVSRRDKNVKTRRDSPRSPLSRSKPSYSDQRRSKPSRRSSSSSSSSEDSRKKSKRHPSPPSSKHRSDRRDDVRRHSRERDRSRRSRERR